MSKKKPDTDITHPYWTDTKSTIRELVYHGWFMLYRSGDSYYAGMGSHVYEMTEKDWKQLVVDIAEHRGCVCARPNMVYRMSRIVDGEVDLYADLKQWGDND